MSSVPDPLGQHGAATNEGGGAAGVATLGAHGERVEKPEEMAPALERALANAPAVVDVVTSQAVVSSDAQKGLGYAPDYQALTAWDDAERVAQATRRNQLIAREKVAHRGGTNP